jgi:ABC-type uncharacterized transport system permease subunit
MSFWEDLSPGVKRYLVFAVLALGLLLAFRTCSAPSTSSEEAPPRGLPR